LSDEFPVYSRAVEYFDGSGWRIICASPPGGTDPRFKKCQLPRRTVGVTKGPRDEVDLTAWKDGHLVLVECKPRLVDSLNRKNALGESDVAKLRRLVLSFPPDRMKDVLHQGYAAKLSSLRDVIPVLCVGVADAVVPEGFTVVILPTLGMVSVNFGDGVAAPIREWFSVTRGRD
jgi:hypothetical protein